MSISRFEYDRLHSVLKHLPFDRRTVQIQKVDRFVRAFVDSSLQTILEISLNIHEPN